MEADDDGERATPPPQPPPPLADAASTACDDNIPDTGTSFSASPTSVSVDAADRVVDSSHFHQQQQQQPRPATHQSQLSTVPGYCSSGSKPECSGCRRPIGDRWLLESVGRSWHEDCLRCSVCLHRLVDVGLTLFAHEDMLLCRRDYLRLFGPAGCCSACCKQIPAFEMVMRVKGCVFHLECFACSQCHHRFCVGDRYYLISGRVVCEYDAYQLMTFSSGSGSTSPLFPVDSGSNGSTYDGLPLDPSSSSSAYPYPSSSSFSSCSSSGISSYIANLSPSGSGNPLLHPLGDKPEVDVHMHHQVRLLQQTQHYRQCNPYSVDSVAPAGVTSPDALASSGGYQTTSYRSLSVLASIQQQQQQQCAGDDHSSGYGSPCPSAD